VLADFTDLLKYYAHAWLFALMAPGLVVAAAVGTILEWS